MAYKDDKQKSKGNTVYLRDNENINHALIKFKKNIEAAVTLEFVRKK